MNEFELEVIRRQVSELLEQGRSRGLDDGERSAILAEVNKLWERLSNVPAARQVARAG